MKCCEPKVTCGEKKGERCKPSQSMMKKKLICFVEPKKSNWGFDKGGLSMQGEC